MSSKHRPSDEKLGQLLKTPHFGKGENLPAADPVAPTPMVLTLEQIRLYDRNPRRERNPRYDEIKDSIRAQGGLNNPLTVTRRPGDEHYMVESGGNTRLGILNELYKETDDETFLRLHVLFRPWRSETHVLAAHLIENEKRGDMLFIDKALAVRELKTLFESEDDGQYSYRQLAQRLKDAGYGVDLNLLSRMDYAVEVLLPLIPEALRAGMGRPQIARIRQIEKAFQAYWTQTANQHEAAFIEVFYDCLAEHNRPEWDNDVLRITLEERLADLLDIPVRSMRLDIDALLHGRKMEDSSPALQPQQSGGVSDSTDETDEQHNVPPDHQPAEQIETSTPAESPRTTQATNDATHVVDSSGASQANPQKSTELHRQHFADNETEEPADAAPLGIEQARRNTYEIAYDLASHYQLEPCVQPSPDWGLGFLVDLPDAPLIPDEARTRDAKQQWEMMLRQWVWWMLYVCSEATAQPERIPNLPETMAIRGLCLKSDQQELMRMLGRPAWVSIAYQLFADPLFPDGHFDSLIALIRQCRQLRSQIGCDNDDALWLQRSEHAPT